MQVDCHVEVPVAGWWPEHDPETRDRVLVETCGRGSQRLTLMRMLAQRPDRLRAVAAVDRQSSCHELQELHAMGVRAARLRHGGLRSGGSVLDAEMVAAGLPAGWHVEVAGSLLDAGRLAHVLSRIGRPVVLEVERAAWSALTESQSTAIHWWLDMGNLYLKLLVACSELPHPAAQTPLGALLDAFPDRFLWGGGALDAPLDARIGAQLDATAGSLYRF